MRQKCNQRCTPSSSSLVANTEVCDSGDASTRCDQCSFSHGECRLNLALFRHGKQLDGLAVESDYVNTGYIDRVVLAKLLKLPRMSPKENIDFRKLFRCCLIVVNHGHDAFFNGLFERYFSILGDGSALR